LRADEKTSGQLHEKENFNSRKNKEYYGNNLVRLFPDGPCDMSITKNQSSQNIPDFKESSKFVVKIQGTRGSLAQTQHLCFELSSEH
jgi:hypothetical protein